MISNHVISCKSPPLRQQRQHDISSVRLATWDWRPPNRKLELVSISEARLQPSPVFCTADILYSGQAVEDRTPHFWQWILLCGQGVESLLTRG